MRGVGSRCSSERPALDRPDGMETEAPPAMGLPPVHGSEPVARAFQGCRYLLFFSAAHVDQAAHSIPPIPDELSFWIRASPDIRSGPRPEVCQVQEHRLLRGCDGVQQIPEQSGAL